MNFSNLVLFEAAFSFGLMTFWPAIDTLASMTTSGSTCGVGLRYSLT